MWSTHRFHFSISAFDGIIIVWRTLAILEYRGMGVTITVMRSAIGSAQELLDIPNNSLLVISLRVTVRAFFHLPPQCYQY